jgi:plastocyanin
MDGHGRRRLLALAIGCLVAALPMIRPAEGASAGVDEVGTSFVPSSIEVSVKDKVIWTNRSSGSHTVTFDNGQDLHPSCDPDALLRVGCQTPGSTAEFTFNSPGKYGYYCKFHGGPGGKGMAGFVVVSAAGTTSTTDPGGSTSTATIRSSTTTTTRPTTTTSSTTTTTRPLATSSTLVKSTTTTSDTSSVLLPGAPPAVGDDTSNAASKSGDPDGGNDTGTVVLIVALLLAVSAGGGFLLWRLRPGRA